MSSLVTQWNGITAEWLHAEHFVNALRGAAWDALLASLTIGFAPACCAALRRLGGAGAASIWGENAEMVKYMVFYLPVRFRLCRRHGHSGCFSARGRANERHPMVIADSALCADFALTFSNVSTGLAQFPPILKTSRRGLGASPRYRLRHVTLPLLMPWMVSALALRFIALHGELGATMMIYPPGWTTLPVAIFSPDRPWKYRRRRGADHCAGGHYAAADDEAGRIAKRLGQK